MGILNVTPDSFSDGGRYVEPRRAVAHGIQLAADGADLVDVGGESTRPGAGRIPLDEELRRVVPVVRELSRNGVRVSVDTTRVAVADAAIRAGADLVNDVSGGLADPAMAEMVAACGVGWVLMHWSGHSSDMDARALYVDVRVDVRQSLQARVDEVVMAGVRPSQLILDPGLGFAKRTEHDLELMAHLADLHALGLPFLIGASRKRFLGAVLAGPDSQPRPIDDRDAATVATSVIAAMSGAWAVRVHDVRSTADALSVAAAVATARSSPAGRDGHEQTRRSVCDT